jgi:stage II sporulation protein D
MINNIIIFTWEDYMKKVLLLVNLMIITILLVCSSNNIYAEENDIREIRVGLKQYYENVESINVANKVLNMGYIIEGDFISEHVFMSSNGYVFKPAKGIYLISKSSFSTYEMLQEQVEKLIKEGYNAYIGSIAKGIWKVYIYCKDNSQVNTTIKKINGKDNLTYEISTDNGVRTIMDMPGQSSIIMENTYQHPQFSTIDNDADKLIIDLGKRQYRGRLEFGRYEDNGITAINVVPLNYYLYSVLPSEMMSYWPMEALKAQAVAARNYAIYYTQTVTKYPNKQYTLCDTTSSQVYKGVSVEDESTNRAVNETTNKLIYYNNKVIPTYFFSTSGGHTENSENVWSGTVPYLKGVPDTYELYPEKKPWVKELTSEEIKAKLLKYDVNIGEITDVLPIGLTDAKRVINLKIVGTSGQHIIKKETMRTWLGLKSRKFKLIKENDIPQKSFNVIGSNSIITEQNISDMYVTMGSNNIQKLRTDNEQLIILSKYNIDNVPTVKGKNDIYTFIGQGWGHGVGMSQSGAKGMALEGFTYEEILNYYYKDVEIR